MTPVNDRLAVPSVSVCIPVYNGADHIAEAIRSVLDQTHSDLELVVCDNASTDDTLAVVARFEDPRIRVVTSDTNIGAGANWNRCLREAASDIVKILCADDVMLPAMIERELVAISSDDDVVLVSARRYVIDEAGRRTMVRGMKGEGRVPGHDAVRKVIRSGSNALGETSSVLLRRSAALAAGAFREDSPYTVDVDLWVRMLLLGDAYVLPEVLSEYRVSGGSWSVSVAGSQAADFIDLVRRSRADRRYGLTAFDAWLGIMRARLNAQLRRVYYAIFVRRGTPR